MTTPARVIPLAGDTASRPATPDSRQLSYWDWEAEVLYYVAENMTWVASSGGAPSNATYITQTPNGSLSNEQALSALSTGLLKSTTGTGVITIAPPAWGNVYALTPPVLADFTAVNQGDATLTQDGVTLLLDAPGTGGGDELRLWVKALPTPPYTVTALFTAQFPLSGFIFGGLALYDSGGGGVVGWGPASSGGTPGVRSMKWNSTSSYNSDYSLDYTLAFQGAMFWMQLVDDGANRLFNMSVDNMPFATLYSFGNTDFITPDKIGFYLNPNGSLDAKLRLISWEES